MKVIFLAKQSQKPSFMERFDEYFEEEKIRRKREQLANSKSRIEVDASLIINDLEELKSLLKEVVDFVNNLPDPATVTEEDAKELGDEAYRLVDKLDIWRDTFSDRCDDISSILRNIALYLLPPEEMPWPEEEERRF
jgi:predicted nuclease with TOPRIM domain